jgi:hypothetical protein
MEEYVAVEPDERNGSILSELEEEEEEEEESDPPLCNQPWQDKFKAMRKLKEFRKELTRDETVKKFKKFCADKSIPYLEDNKTNIEMLLSAGMLVLQTYILATITIVNMVHSSIIGNEVVHDMLVGLMDRGIMWQHYCTKVCVSHKVDTRLKSLFDPYKTMDAPEAFNNKLDVIYEEALIRYMSTEQETVDGGSNAKKSV